MAGETYARRWATWHDLPTADTPADAQYYQKAEDALVRLLGEDPLVDEVPVWDSGLGRFKFIKLTATQLASGAAILGSQLASGLTGPPGSQIAHDEVATNQTFTVTTAATATQIIAGSTVAYNGTDSILIEFFCPKVWHSVASTGIFFELYDSATGLGLIASGRSVSTTDGDMVYGARKLTPSNSSHTYNIRAWVAAAGTGTAAAGGGGAAGTLVPMFLRITKA
jgi:hypothetical protein